RRRLRTRRHLAQAEPNRAFGVRLFATRRRAPHHALSTIFVRGGWRTRRRNLLRTAFTARLELRERIVALGRFRILRDRNFDLIGVDEDHVAVVQLGRFSTRDAVVRRVDEDAVGAGVLDEILAAYIADQGVAARDVRIRKHPVVVRQAPDGAANGVEYLAAPCPEVLCLLANDFQRKDHGLSVSVGRRILDYGNRWSIAVSARGSQQ